MCEICQCSQCPGTCPGYTPPKRRASARGAFFCGEVWFGQKEGATFGWVGTKKETGWFPSTETTENNKEIRTNARVISKDGEEDYGKKNDLR